MQNQNQVQIHIFEHQDFGKLEMIMIDGKPHFPAVECAEILGYSKPHNAISRHCARSLKRGVVTQTTNQHGKTSYQTVEKIYIPEGDLYRLIIRSKLPEAIKFEAWVCDTVIPSIRQFGAYVTDEMLDHLIDNPESMKKLFETLKNERTEKEALERIQEALVECIGELLPKAGYHDTVLQCPGLIQVSIIAKDYGYTAIEFNKLLHAIGFQYKIGQTWLPYHQYDNRGFTVSRTYRINATITAVHTCFTQKGRYFIYKLLKSYGIMPLAERIA